MSDFTSILCCINLGENNEDIISYTKKLATKDATIHLVQSVPSMTALKNVADTYEGIFEKPSQNYQKNLEEIKTKFFADFTNVKIYIIDGETSSQILKFVDKCCADLIIMGTASSKNFLSIFTHKPANEVANHTRIPLFLIPNELSFECTPEM